MTCASLLVLISMQQVQASVPVTLDPCTASFRVNGSALMASDGLIAVSSRTIELGSTEFVRVYDRLTGKKLIETKSDLFALSPDRTRYAVAEENEIQVFNAESGAILKKTGYFKLIRRLRLLSSGGSHFAVCDTGDGETQVIDLSSGKLLSTKKPVSLDVRIGPNRLMGQMGETASEYQLLTVSPGNAVFKNVPVIDSSGGRTKTGSYNSLWGSQSGRYFGSRPSFSDPIVRSIDDFRPVTLPKGYFLFGFYGDFISVRRHIDSVPSALYDPRSKKLYPVTSNALGKITEYGGAIHEMVSGLSGNPTVGKWHCGKDVVARGEVLKPEHALSFHVEGAFAERYKRTVTALSIQREINGISVKGWPSTIAGIKGKLLDVAYAKDRETVIGLTESSVIWARRGDTKPFRTIERPSGTGWRIAGQLGDDLLCYNRRFFDEVTSLALVTNGRWEELPDIFETSVAVVADRAYCWYEGKQVKSLDIAALKGKRDATRASDMVSICTSSYDDSVWAIRRKTGKLLLFSGNQEVTLPLNPSASIEITEVYPGRRLALMAVKEQRGDLAEEYSVLVSTTSGKLVYVGSQIPTELTETGHLVSKSMALDLSKLSQP